MKINRSPWIHQLNGTRPMVSLTSDQKTDVVIVGAGIAGVATAFFLLKNTDKKLVMLEAWKLAHGATGHNAGQITSYFERSLADIAKEFGLPMAKEGQEAIESIAWKLLDEIYTEAGLTIPFSRFIGHAGFVNLEDTLHILSDNAIRKQAGMKLEEILISEEAPFLLLIPEEFNGLYKIARQEDVWERLETRDPRFFVCVSNQKGCLNSALFCQEVMTFLLEKYKDRFSLFEHSHVKKVLLRKDHAILDVGEHTVESEKVILCTNGFENFHIINDAGLGIDTKFHHSIGGLIGFMSGYLKDYDKPPVAISYIFKPGSKLDGEYIYLTRREYEYTEKGRCNLISIGGPEMLLDDKTFYNSDIDYPEEAQESIDGFAREVFEADAEKEIKYEFQWHGVMGYTPSRLRIIGEEPKNKVLLYNLGCNGVGILPSIYGGKRISDIIAGENITPSIFDPKE